VREEVTVIRMKNVRLDLYVVLTIAENTILLQKRVQTAA